MPSSRLRSIASMWRIQGKSRSEVAMRVPTHKSSSHRTSDTRPSVRPPSCAYPEGGKTRHLASVDSNRWQAYVDYGPILTATAQSNIKYASRQTARIYDSIARI